MHLSCLHLSFASMTSWHVCTIPINIELAYLPHYWSCRKYRNFYSTTKNRSNLSDGFKGSLGPVWPEWAIYWTLGNFSKPVATIIFPKSPTFLGNFYKDVKIFHVSCGNIFGLLLWTFGDFLLVTLNAHSSAIFTQKNMPTLFKAKSMRLRRRDCWQIIC